MHPPCSTSCGELKPILKRVKFSDSTPIITKKEEPSIVSSSSANVNKISKISQRRKSMNSARSALMVNDDVRKRRIMTIIPQGISQRRSERIANKKKLLENQ